MWRRGRIVEEAPRRAEAERAGRRGCRVALRVGGGPRASESRARGRATRGRRLPVQICADELASAAALLLKETMIAGRGERRRPRGGTRGTRAPTEASCGSRVRGRAERGARRSISLQSRGDAVRSRPKRGGARLHACNPHRLPDRGRSPRRASLRPKRCEAGGGCVLSHATHTAKCGSSLGTCGTRRGDRPMQSV